MGASQGLQAGQVQHVLGDLRQAVVPVAHQGQDAPIPGRGLLDVGEDLLRWAIVGHEGDDGHVLVDEGDGAVLHLPGGIALGVDVGDLLELEGPFQRDGVERAAAEEEEVAWRRAHVWAALRRSARSSEPPGPAAPAVPAGPGAAPRAARARRVPRSRPGARPGAGARPAGW